MLGGCQLITHPVHAERSLLTPAPAGPVSAIPVQTFIHLVICLLSPESLQTPRLDSGSLALAGIALAAHRRNRAFIWNLELVRQVW